MGFPSSVDIMAVIQADFYDRNDLWTMVDVYRISRWIAQIVFMSKGARNDRRRCRRR